MNNKRNISFSTIATVLIIALLVIVSCSGLIAVVDKMMVSDETVAAEMNALSNIPNFDFNNSLLLDSSVQEDGVLKNLVSQKPVNSETTITSNNTAISFDFNCPDKTSKAVLVPELTILPIPILKLIPKFFGADFHEIEFSLYGTAFNKLNEKVCAGLGFDFYGIFKQIGTLYYSVIV